MAAHTTRRFCLHGHVSNGFGTRCQAPKSATSRSEPRLRQKFCSEKKRSLDVSHTESIWKTLVTIEGNPHALHLGDPCALYICKKRFHSTVATTTISKFEDRFSAVPAYHNEGVCSLRQAWLPPLPHHGRIDEPLNALNRPNPMIHLSAVEPSIYSHCIPKLNQCTWRLHKMVVPPTSSFILTV